MLKRILFVACSLKLRPIKRYLMGSLALPIHQPERGRNETPSSPDKVRTSQGEALVLICPPYTRGGPSSSRGLANLHDVKRGWVYHGRLLRGQMPERAKPKQSRAERPPSFDFVVGADGHVSFFLFPFPPLGLHT